MSNPMSLEGHNIIVTGAGSGIGEVTATGMRTEVGLFANFS